MDIGTLEQEVTRLRSGPLPLLCRTPAGIERIMTARECLDTGSAYIHIAGLDELDDFLARELGREAEV